MDLMPVMPIAEVAASVSALLTPFLPYLIKFGETTGAKALEGMGKKIGEDGWDSVKLLWSKLKPQLSDTDADKRVVELASKVETAEADGRLKEIETAANVFQFEIERLLNSNSELAQEITRLIKDSQDKHNNGGVFNIENQFAKNLFNIGRIDTLTIN